MTPIMLAAAIFVAAPANAETFVVWFDDSCVADTAACTPGLLNGISYTLDGGVVNAHALGIFRGDNTLGFNIAGSHAGLTIDIQQFAAYTLGGNNQTIGPFGSFEFLIDGPPIMPNPNTGFFNFTLTRDEGFLDPFDVFAMNELGFLGAAHTQYFFTAGTFFTAGRDISTMPSPVPEPATMLLLGTGLVAAWRARRI